MMLRHAPTFTLIAMGNMSSSDMAQVESAYFYGYCIGTAPMGFVADAIGARVFEPEKTFKPEIDHFSIFVLEKQRFLNF